MNIALTTPEPLTENFAHFKDLDNPSHDNGYASWSITKSSNNLYLIAVSGNNADGTPFDLFQIEETLSAYPTPGQVFWLIAEALKKGLERNDGK